MNRTFAFLGALSAMCAVILGATGAHIVRNHASAMSFSIYQTAVHYQFYHSLGLILIGISAAHLSSKVWLNISGWLMFAGIILFSGSLYVLTLGGFSRIGILAPFGGSAFILAWLSFLIAILTSKKEVQKSTS